MNLIINPILNLKLDIKNDGKINIVVIGLVLICLCFCVSGEEMGRKVKYSEAKSIEYMFFSALAYCSMSKVKKWDIGKLHQTLKNWRLLYGVAKKTVQSDEVIYGYNCQR